MVFNLFIGLVIPVMLFSYDQKIDSALSAAGKGMLGADLMISSRIKPREKSLELVDEILGEKLDIKAKMYSLFTMARGGDKLSLIQLRYIEGMYPFYGKIETETGITIDQLKAREIIVKKEILLKFNKKVGEAISIGGEDFVIKDIITKDIGESIQIGNMAPRVYLNFSERLKNNLMKKGSTIFYSNFYKSKGEISEELFTSLKNKVTDSELRFTLPKQSNNTFARGIKLVLDFSQLIFICGILISVTAYFYIFKHFLVLESKNIDVYHNLGLKKFVVSSIYLIYSLICFFFSMIGVILIVFGLKDQFEKVFQGFLPPGMELSSNIVEIPYLFILLLALFVTSFVAPLIFSKIRYRKSNLVHWLPAFLIFNIMLVWQTQSMLWAPAFIIVLSILGLLFYYLVPKIFTPLINHKSLTIQLAMKSLVRNKSVLFTRFIMIVMTFSIINLVPIIFNSLNHDLNYGKTTRPEYFLFDIQDDQIEGLRQFFEERGIKTTRFAPMIRARLLEINGKKVDVKSTLNESREEEVERRSRNRGVNLSYKDGLNHAETVIRGSFVTEVYSGEGPIHISLEERYAKRLGVDLGEKLTFSIFDLPFEGVVSSVRKVKWTSFLPNFFILFQKGVLEDAPKTYLTTLSSKDIDYKNIIDLNDRFPNVTSLDVKNIMREISKFLGSMQAVLFQMIIVFVVITLIAFLSLNFFQLKVSSRTNSLYRHLGLTYKNIKNIHLFSYCSLSLVSILFAIVLANLLGFIILKFFMNIDYVFTTDYLILNLIPILGLFLFNKKVLGYERI